MAVNLHLSVEEPANKIPKFNPFSGLARRLDGKLSTQPATATTESVLKQDQPEVGKDVSVSKPLNSSSRSHSGKLVFGSNRNQPQNEAQKVWLILFVVLQDVPTFSQLFDASPRLSHFLLFACYKLISIDFFIPRTP